MKNELENKQSLENFNMEDFISSSIANSSSKGTSLVMPNEKNQPSNDAGTREVSQESAENEKSAKSVEDADMKESMTPKPSKKTVTSKQRKTNLLEYQQTFLTVPKITDRKTVFISNELRTHVVSIVRKLGTEKSSVSGFVENLIRNHLIEYKDDIDSWKKL